MPAALRHVNPLAEILSAPGIQPLPAVRGGGRRPEPLQALPVEWRGPQSAGGLWEGGVNLVGHVIHIYIYMYTLTYINYLLYTNKVS